MPEQSTSAPFDPADYWEQRLANRYTLGSTGWSSLGEAFNRWSYAVRAVAFNRVVRNVLGDAEPGRVLDVGSGTGFYLRQWQRLGARDVAGSDLTSVAVERLRHRFPGTEIHRLDIGDLELPPLGPPYDVISVMDVLFHLVDDGRYERALANLSSLLKPDGVLIFTENTATVRREGKHQIIRAQDEIESALARAGLTVVCAKPVFFLMNTPVSSQSGLLHRWWNLVCRVVRRHESIGWLVGAALFPVEVTLARLLADGPSTEIIAARSSPASSGSRNPPAA